MSTKQLPKGHELNFRFFRCKSQKPQQSQNNLSFVDPLQPSDLLKASRRLLPMDLANLYVNTSLCHLCYTFTYVYLHRFQVPILRTRLFLRVHSISYPTHDPERTSSKPFTRLIGLRHVTKSGGQNVLLTFSSFKKPRHLKIIYIQNRSCYCLMASGK